MGLERPEIDQTHQYNTRFGFHPLHWGEWHRLQIIREIANPNRVPMG